MTKVTDLRAITPAEAFAEAERVLSTPLETLYHDKELRRVIAGLVAGINRSKCFAKAMRTGCESFTLLETDTASHFAVDEWSRRAVAHGHEHEKAAQAAVMAGRWRGRERQAAARVAIGAE